jgi:hypothetical protein
MTLRRKTCDRVRSSLAQIASTVARIVFGILKAVAGSDIFNVVLLFSIIDSKVSQQIRPNQSSQGRRSGQGTTDASAEFIGLIHKSAPSLFYLSFDRVHWVALFRLVLVKLCVHYAKSGPNVRFAPKATKLLCGSKMTLWAMSGLLRCNKVGVVSNGRCQAFSSSNRVLACFKSSVSKPSVNQP